MAPDPSQTRANFLFTTDSSTHPFQAQGSKKMDLTDYPLVITDSYDGQQLSSDLKTISVKKGATGKVGSVTSNWKYVYVMLFKGQDRNGIFQGLVVPGNIVKIGIDRKHGDTRRVREGVDMTAMARLTADNIANSHVLHSRTAKTIMIFVDHVERGRSILPFVTKKQYGIIKRYGDAAGVANKWFKHMAHTNPGLPGVLDGKKEFTYREVLKNSRHAKTSDDTVDTVAYLYHEKDWPGNPNKKACGYAGTSEKRITKRRKEHTDRLANPNMKGAKAFRYTYARGAEYRDFGIFMAFPEADFRDLAEQILIVIFELQAPFVRDADLSSTEFSLNANAFGDAEKQSYIACLEDQYEGGLPRLDSHEMLDAKIQGKIFKMIFDKAKAETGYIGGCSRPSFECEVGTNHTSPLGTVGWNMEKGFITVVDFPDYTNKIREFSRRKIGRRKMMGNLNIRPAVKLPPSSQLSAVVQVMKNDAPHPYPYPHLATIGPFRSWNRSNAVGIRLEWKGPNDETQGFWIQAHWSYSFIKAADGSVYSGAQEAFAQTDALLRFLAQETLIGAPPWFVDNGTARLLDVTFDFLAQTSRLKERAPPPPRAYQAQQHIKTMAEIQTELQNIFPRDAIFDADGRSKKCDKCKAKSYHRRSGKTTLGDRSPASPCQPIGQADGSWRCDACKDSGVPCTFTETDELLEDKAKLDAVTYQDKSVASRVLFDLPPADWETEVVG